MYVISVRPPSYPFSAPKKDKLLTSKFWVLLIIPWSAEAYQYDSAAKFNRFRAYWLIDRYTLQMREWDYNEVFPYSIIYSAQASELHPRAP